MPLWLGSEPKQQNSNELEELRAHSIPSGGCGIWAGPGSTGGFGGSWRGGQSRELSCGWRTRKMMSRICLLLLLVMVVGVEAGRGWLWARKHEWSSKVFEASMSSLQNSTLLLSSPDRETAWWQDFLGFVSFHYELMIINVNFKWISSSIFFLGPCEENYSFDPVSPCLPKNVWKGFRSDFCRCCSLQVINLLLAVLTLLL